MAELAGRVAGRLLAARGRAAEGGAVTAAGVHVSLNAPRPGVGAGPVGGVAGDAVAGDAVAGAAVGEGARPGWRLAVGADHGGFALKAALVELLERWGHRVLDLGTFGSEPVDYPDVALAVAEAVRSGRAELGVLVDGAGLGSAMAANKVPGVRAAPCTSEALARNARAHNHANVLSLGAGHLDAAAAGEILRAFLTTPPGPDRHARRVAKIDAIEARFGPGAHPHPLP